MDILNEKIEGLVKKAEKSGMPYGILKKVYDRGMAAWKTGHRPGTTPQQWAFARVNSFITKSSGTWGKADKDLAKQVRGEEVERRKTASEMLGQVRETNLQEALASENGGPQIMFYYDVGPQPFSDDQKKAAKLMVKIIKKQFNKLPNKLGVPYGRGTTADLPVPNLRGNFASGAIDLQGSIESHIAFQKELKKQMPNIKLYYGTPHIFSNMKFSDWDRRFPIKLTKYKVIEKGPNATMGIDNVYEKLDKDADAGDYVKDFRKSDAPQFKGKSDKKKQKMAIAAYLDSKEEVEEERRQLKDPKKEAMVMKLKGSYAGNIQVIDKKELEKYLSKGYIRVENNIKEENCPDCNEDPCKCKSLQEALKINYVLIDTSRNDKVIAMSSDEQGVKDSMRTANLPPLKVKNKSSLKVVKLKRPKGDNMAGKLIGEPLKSWGEETDIQESGHTDVASMKTQVQIAKDALEKMNMELGKLSDEEDLPTWWTNKVATAVSKLDGMADYIDAKSDQGEKMNEDNITEEKVFTVRFEKEGMRFAVPFSDMKRAKDGEKILKKSAGVSNVSVTKDILKPGVSMSKFRTQQEGKILPESKMGEYFLDMQMDAQEMSERDFIKKYRGEMGMSPQELKRMHKEFNEEVDNSLMAQATRVISHTSIKEKIDPADIDNIATADDRKAADKNIIIQLRRAQDMQGKADVTFKDKPNKKEKLDIRVINKALDMFDKMRPNDKAKMQTTIGKSYRDLLKTVQRGRV